MSFFGRQKVFFCGRFGGLLWLIRLISFVGRVVALSLLLLVALVGCCGLFDLVVGGRKATTVFPAALVGCCGSFD